jgi:hypothetical protein
MDEEEGPLTVIEAGKPFTPSRGSTSRSSDPIAQMAECHPRHNQPSS